MRRPLPALQNFLLHPGRSFFPLLSPPFWTIIKPRHKPLPMPCNCFQSHGKAPTPFSHRASLGRQHILPLNVFGETRTVLSNDARDASCGGGDTVGVARAWHSTGPCDAMRNGHGQHSQDADCSTGRPERWRAAFSSGSNPRGRQTRSLQHPRHPQPGGVP